MFRVMNFLCLLKVHAYYFRQTNFEASYLQSLTEQKCGISKKYVGKMSKIKYTYKQIRINFNNLELH